MPSNRKKRFVRPPGGLAKEFPIFPDRTPKEIQSIRELAQIAARAAKAHADSPKPKRRPVQQRIIDLKNEIRRFERNREEAKREQEPELAALLTRRIENIQKQITALEQEPNQKLPKTKKNKPTSSKPKIPIQFQKEIARLRKHATRAVQIAQVAEHEYLGKQKGERRQQIVQRHRSAVAAISTTIHEINRIRHRFGLEPLTVDAFGKFSQLGMPRK